MAYKDREYGRTRMREVARLYRERWPGRIKAAKNKWYKKSRVGKAECLKLKCRRKRFSRSLYCSKHTIQKIPLMTRPKFNSLNSQIRRSMGCTFGSLPRDAMIFFSFWLDVKRDILASKYDRKPKELSMDIQKIKQGISNPAMQELVEAILQTVEEVKSGKKSHNQGLTELSGYKQVVQIMALEVMRHRLPVQGFLSGPH